MINFSVILLIGLSIPSTEMHEKDYMQLVYLTKKLKDAFIKYSILRLKQIKSGLDRFKNAEMKISK